MRRDANPRRLPASFALAAVLFVLSCLLVPRSWVEQWLRPYAGRDRDGRQAAAPLQILPAPWPEPAAAPAAADSASRDDPAPPETSPSRDAGWWTAAWRDWTASRARDLCETAPRAPLDFDLLASRLLAATPDSLWRRARVDTTRVARLAAIRAFYSADLRRALPELHGTMATRKATEILNREAELFGEYLLLR